MLTIEVNNSVCRIPNLRHELFNKLRNLLSYTNDPTSAFFSGGYPKQRYLLSKRGDFPTGLLYLVEDYLLMANLPYTLKDHRKVPTPLLGLFTPRLTLTPYPEQWAAAWACQVEHRGIIAAPTGVGKSVIIALIIGQLRVPTLVVVPSLGLKHQLTEFLGKVFDQATLKHITVENVDALNPNKPAKVDCVIIDEFHHSGAKTYRELNIKAWGGVYYKFGLTATPFRSQDFEKLLLESVLSRVIYRVDHERAVKAGYIVPVEAYYYDLPHTEETSNHWPQVYQSLVVENDVRNATVADLLDVLASQGQSTLCLVREIKHGVLLSKLTGVPFANGEDGEARKLIESFNRGEIKTLIGTTGVLGEGIDTKPAEWIVIAGLGKSKNTFMQQCGRGFRKYPGKESCKVIIFKDRSHKFTLNHYNAQVKYLREEYGVIPLKLEVKESEP